MDVKTITLASGATVPALGQGTWYLGDDPAARAREISALRTGVGAGLRRKEDLDQIRQMADLIHADIGVTRALVEKGWAPKEYQIGLSGRAVQPELYIALGISGASQHLIGLRKCKNIIAVNRDANATVFQYATVGIVADFYDVLPRLSQMILNRRKDG